MVEMKQPAMGMKEQIKTKSESRPMPGIFRAHIPAAVKAVFTMAMRACTDTTTSSELDSLHAWSKAFTHTTVPKEVVQKCAVHLLSTFKHLTGSSPM